MYLKSLTLKGFKSFADKTPMIFQDGLNVVVGPNGSGKSNVADAILWVLGEQSAKQLRGQAMEDVIFSGSAERKSVSVAEVTLVLSNEDGTLPLDFAEIAITRRMYRTGESEYYINGAPSRLLDITEILHDSGLGRETSSIISQGKLDAVLSNRPEERRELVEEAAGIAKHRRRKKRAERKLARMDEHVARAKIINRELKRRLRPLEDQVGKAQTFKELEAERISLSTEIAVDDVRRLQTRCNDLMVKKQEVEAQVSLREFEEKEKREHLEKLQTMLEKRGLYVGDISEQRRRVGALETKVEATLSLLAEKERSLNERISSAASQMANVSEQLRANERRMADFERTLEEARAVTRKETANVAAYKPKTEEIQKSLSELDGNITKWQSEKMQLAKETDEALLAHTKLEHEIQSQELQGGIWVKKVASLKEEISSLETSLKESTLKLNAEKAAQEKAEKSLADTEETLQKVQSELSSERENLSQLQKDVLSQRAEKGALEDLLSEADGAEVPEPIKLAKDKKTLLSSVAQFIAFPKELEGVAEALLGHFVQAQVVASASDLRALVSQMASDYRDFKGTFIAEGEGEKGAETPQVNEASKKAGVTPFAKAYEQALENEGTAPEKTSVSLVKRLFGNVVLVETNDEVLSLSADFPQLTIASKEGLVAFSNGVVSLGLMRSEEGSSLAQSRRLRELNSSLPKAEKELDKLAGHIDQLVSQESDMKKTLDALHQEFLEKTSAVNFATQEAEHQEKQKQDLQGELETIEASQKKAIEEGEAKQKQLSEYQEKMEGARAAQTKLDEEIENATAKRTDLRQAEIDYLKHLNEAKLSLEAAEERVSRIEKEKEEFASFKDSSATLTQNLRETQTRLKIQKDRIPAAQVQLKKLLELVGTWVAKLQDSATLAASDSEELRQTIEDARAEAEKAREAHTKAVADQNKLEIEEGKIEVQVTGAVEALKEVASISVDEALLFEPIQNREEKASRLAEVKAALASLGPVNQVALEEYDDLKERAAFYENQLEDLKLARRALAKITKTIDARMRGAFEETYAEVNKHFAETFALFFPGGKAHLELSDPENLEETGIEIVAQPKGKRIPKIALMSGGEKSLTALAFLFAIYQTHTVPFYVFDEVEAALDDANLDKFLNAVMMLKEDTQLIVISHQRRTMEAADVLYGVSMQSDGISKVVSQKLDEYEKKFLEA